MTRVRGRSRAGSSTSDRASKRFRFAAYVRTSPVRVQYDRRLWPLSPRAGTPSSSQKRSRSVSRACDAAEDDPLSHYQTVLVQELARGAPNFHAPVSTIDALPAVRAIAFRPVGLDAQPRALAERISPEPAMDDDAVARRADLSVEDDGPRKDRISGGHAAEVVSRKAPAEAHGRQLSAARRRGSRGAGDVRRGLPGERSDGAGC